MDPDPGVLSALGASDVRHPFRNVHRSPSRAILNEMPDDLFDLLRRPATTVAPELLGRVFSTRVGGKTTSVRLTEVEAYMGADDPASHAYNGITTRTEPMFMAPPRIYVYLIYGVHFCVNVVTGPEGEAGAVLLRGGLPVEGVPTMEERRGRSDNLTNGPGKLAQALGLSTEHSGRQIDGNVFSLAAGQPFEAVTATPRIGITKAVDRPWRFVAEGHV